MVNLVYKDYPYGKAEGFAEYEVRAFDESQMKNIELYSLYELKKPEMRYVPKNFGVHQVYAERKPRWSAKACLQMLSRDTLKEILFVLKTRPKEGVLRSIYRIYRYLYAAEAMKANFEYDKSEENVFLCYWLNECAYAALKIKDRHPGVKVVSRGHGFDILEERCYMPFRRKILGSLDQIFVISKTAYQYLEERYPWLDMKKVQVSHLGVNIPKNVCHVSRRKPFHLVTCSSVIPLKRLDLLIDALAGIESDGIVWTHLGDGPLKKDLCARADKEFAGRNITVNFKGQLRLEDVHRFYETEEIHLFVNCSDTEGVPVSVMEAMSYGIPCIARNVGGNGELVDNCCGRVISSEANPEELAEAIRCFMQMSDQNYETFRTNARAKIMRQFNSEITYSEYVEKINEMFGRSSTEAENRP